MTENGRMTKTEAYKLGHCAGFCVHGKKQGRECVALNKYYGVPESDCIIVFEQHNEWKQRIRGSK